MLKEVLNNGWVRATESAYEPVPVGARKLGDRFVIVQRRYFNVPSVVLLVSGSVNLTIERFDLLLFA